MSDAVTRDAPGTIADHEAFLDARAGDERFELIRGRIAMVTNPSGGHGQIVGNAYAPLKAAMDDAGCRAYAGGVRVQRSEDPGDDMAAIPDILVRCGPRRDRDFVVDPLVVVEVLSRSTMVVDRGAKFRFYRGLPSLQHVVLVHRRQMRVEHDSRTGENWRAIELIRPSDRLDLDAVAFAIDLHRVHFGVTALRPVEAPEADGDASA